MKIAVGMSGGVDSSVAAAILKDRGHEVIGLSMALWNDTYACTGVKKYTCFGPNEK
jgi:tRNA-specific 2-thiouridylase